MASLATKSLLLLGFAGAGILLGCSEQEPGSSASVVENTSVEEVPHEEISGQAIYLKNCALCHGEKGDGVGLVALERPARSFLQGGFSFGNTPEAIFRTISNGIGGTPMPGFAESLSEEARRAVAAYVIAFGPEQIVVQEGATVLSVKERPQVIRGGFPPVADGVEMTPRGLLVGGLDGLSFQYDASDLRLLAVRQGGFVDRADWGDRGGAALKPLGQIIFLYSQGAPSASWWGEDAHGQSVALQARLLATEVRQEVAWVEYQLLLQGVPQATVRESGKAVSYGPWSGFRRTFEVAAVGETLPRIWLAPPSEAPAHLVLEELAGETKVFAREGQTPLLSHREQWSQVQEQDRFTLTEDLLFGLNATEENLTRLVEALF